MSKNCFLAAAKQHGYVMVWLLVVLLQHTIVSKTDFINSVYFNFKNRNNF